MDRVRSVFDPSSNLDISGWNSVSKEFTVLHNTRFNMKTSQFIPILLLLFAFGCSESPVATETSVVSDATVQSQSTSESETLAKRLDGSSHGGRPLTATLSGDQEVPPADPDGSGTATVTLNHGQGEFCYELSVTDIGAAAAAHIHSAPAGQNGGVVIPLTAPSGGSSSDCLSVDRELIKAILQTPENYYFNVHNPEFPGGAVRGQLSK